MSAEDTETGEGGIVPEVAEADFNRFAEMMDLDVDETRMSAEDVATFKEQKARLLRAMLRGHLVVNEKGEPVYTPQLGIRDPITFHEPDGATMMAMDKLPKGENAARTHALLGAMTGKPPVLFAKMKSRDLKNCSAILNLFLG